MHLEDCPFDTYIWNVRVALYPAWTKMNWKCLFDYEYGLMNSNNVSVEKMDRIAALLHWKFGINAFAYVESLIKT